MDKAAKVTITKKRKLDSDDEQTPQKVPRILHAIRKREQINQSLIDRKQFHLVPSLTKIRIRDVNFDQDRAEIFARALKSTTHLREVILHTNHVHDQDAKAVCKLLTNKFLTYLNLSDNDIELEEEWFTQSLASSSLEELDLRDNLIGREGEKNLAEAIGQNTSLKRLSLADNPMPCTLIGDGLAKNNSLQFLDLEKTALSTAGWTSIATSLKTNKSLVVLNMNDANVTNDDLQALIDGVKLHPKLIFISLIGTQISKHILQEFSDYLYEKQHFKQLKKEISEEAFLIKKCYKYDYGSSIETSSMSDSEDDITYSHNEFITMNRVPPVRYNKFTFPLYNEDSPEYALHVARRFPEVMNEISFDQQISNSLVEAKKEFQKNAEEALTALETSKNNAERTNEELRASFESLQTEEKELKAQLARIKTRLKEMKNESTLKQEALIFYEINSSRLQMKFSAARTNVEDSKNELDQYEERVKKFRAKMKNLTWTTDDLLEFLEITCASKETMAAIEGNKIDGDILKTLPTVDLVKTLKMTFKDAKRLQTYMRLINSGKDVFNPCTGVLSWRSKDVSEWLKQNNLAKLATKFQRQIITGQELLMIDKNDLAQTFKITSIAEKTAFETAINDLRKEFDPFGEFDDDPVIEVKPDKNKKDIGVKKEVKKKPPSALICPLTKLLMTDPVQLSDGHTYERGAIEKWLVDHDTSPVTHESLASKQCFPSFAIKAMINEFNINNS